MKIVWNLMLVMSLLVLGIEFLQYVMDFLADVLNPFNKFGCIINLYLSMDIFLLRGCNGNSYINWGQWLEIQAHLKRVMDNRDMKGSIVSMMCRDVWSSIFSGYAQHHV
jgi:hypothetical protein